MLVIICSVILILGIVLGVGLLQKDKNDVVLRYDKEPLLSRFPLIGNIEKCYWEADVIGKSSLFTAPSPSSYWMKGYIFLSKLDIDNIKSQYKWVSVENDWKPSLDESILNFKSLKWQYSQEYNDYIKPVTFFGKFYLNFEHGIVCFEVEK